MIIKSCDVLKEISCLLKGIERFRRLAEITDEVKHALRPYYIQKAVSKAEYKDIFKRAVKKVSY